MLILIVPPIVTQTCPAPPWPCPSPRHQMVAMARPLTVHPTLTLTMVSPLTTTKAQIL